jgi:hypothetical protein
MDVGYSGHRPRIQLFHGDADTTINYKNLGEAVKEWSNLLGLAATPSSTDMGVPLGNHQATRQRWQNSCGYVVLDAFTSLGGDHGPSDALFKAQYVIPFLGLDKTGTVDPEIEQCSDGGAGGSSAVDAGAGMGGGGGATGNKDAGAGGGAGNQGTGGSAGTGGASGSPGVGGASGMGGSGGSPIGGAAGDSPMTGVEAGSGGCACALGLAGSNEPAELAILALGLALVTRARASRKARRDGLTREQ